MLQNPPPSPVKTSRGGTIAIGETNDHLHTHNRREPNTADLERLCGAGGVAAAPCSDARNCMRRRLRRNCFPPWRRQSPSLTRQPGEPSRAVRWERMPPSVELSQADCDRLLPAKRSVAGKACTYDGLRVVTIALVS